MLALAGLAILAVVSWFAPWRVAVAIFVIGATVILLASGGSLSHW